MSTTILAVRGKKQSGKSSLCAYIQSLVTKAAYNAYTGKTTHDAPERVDFFQRPTGEIVWVEGDEALASADHILDDDLVARLGLGPQSLNEGDVRIYSFADSLKEVCVNVLGLKPEQCYGTDEQKNSLTHLVWENIPYYVRWYNSGRWMNGWLEETQIPADVDEKHFYNNVYIAGWQPIKLKSGPMTGREVMQVFGTDVMRKMFYNDVWVNATVNRINSDNLKLALLADMRFRSELKALYPSGAYIINLERNVLNDQHSSEVDFDGFDWTPYADRLVTVPAEADLHEKNEIVWKWLSQKLPHLFAI